MSDGIDLLNYLTRWRADLIKAADLQRKISMDQLTKAETIEADIADLDRAIAALTPAQPSQSEEAKPDALAEFMKRERAVKWMGGDCPFPIGTYVVMLHRDGTEQGRYITHSDDYSGDYAWGRSDFGHREDDIVAFIDPQLATTKQQKGDDSEPLGCFEPGSGDGEESDGVAIPEGFTAHDGGACPVEGSTRVDVILASGARGFHQQNRFADSLAWERDYIGDRIIAYRVLPSEPAAEESYGEWREGRVIDPRSIASSEQHAEESAIARQNVPSTNDVIKHPPLLPPEPPPAATPEQLEATGVIDGEAGWWGRKLMKERA